MASPTQAQSPSRTPPMFAPYRTFRAPTAPISPPPPTSTISLTCSSRARFRKSPENSSLSLQKPKIVHRRRDTQSLRRFLLRSNRRSHLQVAKPKLQFQKGFPAGRKKWSARKHLYRIPSVSVGFRTSGNHMQQNCVGSFRVSAWRIGSSAQNSRLPCSPQILLSGYRLR